MMGVSEQMIQQLRSCMTADTPQDEFVPLPEMGGYFVSKTKQDSKKYKYMFPVEVDGSELHIYISL